MWSETLTLKWITLGNNAWVRVDQIEGLWLDARRRVVVKAISGEQYVAEDRLTIKQVLDRMAKGEQK